MLHPLATVGTNCDIPPARVVVTGDPGVVCYAFSRLS